MIGKVNDKGGTPPNSTYAITNSRIKEYPDGFAPLPLSYAACITCADDVNYTSNVSAVSAEWARANDAESGVFTAEWAAGTHGYVDNVVPWRTAVDVGLSANDTSVWARPEPGMLLHNTTYFVTVRVRNGAGLVSFAMSTGVLVDITPPVITQVWDLDPTRKNVTAETNVSVATNLASAAVHAYDPESGLLEWHYAISTSPTTCTEEYRWVAVLAPSPTDPILLHSAQHLRLTPGAMYYHCVRVVNRAGVQSSVHFSDGWRVGLRTELLPTHMETLLFVDPDNIDVPTKAVSMMANVTAGVFSTPATFINLEASISAVVPPTQVMFAELGHTTPLLASAYVRDIVFPVGELLQPLRIQVRYLTGLNGSSVTLSDDIDAWLLIQRPSSSRRLLSPHTAPHHSQDASRMLASQDWRLLSEGCFAHTSYARTVDYTRGVVSSWVCEPGVIALFYQHRPTVNVQLLPPAASVIAANASRYVTVAGTATDPDAPRGGSVVYTHWSVSGDPDVVVTAPSALATVVGPLRSGATEISLLAMDDMNATTIRSITVVVRPFAEYGNVSLSIKGGTPLVGVTSLHFTVTGVGVAAGDRAFLVPMPAGDCGTQNGSTAYTWGTVAARGHLEMTVSRTLYGAPLVLCYKHDRLTPVLYNTTYFPKVCMTTWRGDWRSGFVADVFVAIAVAIAATGGAEWDTDKH